MFAAVSWEKIMADKINSGETADYRKARNELLAAETELRNHCERVAELRRELPMGAPVPTDYVFREGPADLSRNDPADFFETRFSDLFAPEKDRLIVQHLMFAPDAEQGCPMCSMWTDGFNAVAPHIAARVNFAVAAKADIAKLRACPSAFVDFGCTRAVGDPPPEQR